MEDNLYEQAKDLVIKENAGSTSLLQRRLKIGYNRAYRLMTALEENGVVGPEKGAGCREVLMTDK